METIEFSRSFKDGKQRGVQWKAFKDGQAIQASPNIFVVSNEYFVCKSLSDFHRGASRHRGRICPFLERSEFLRLKFKVLVLPWFSSSDVSIKSRMVAEIEMLELMTTLLTFFAPSLMLVASSQSGTRSSISELNSKLLNKWIEASQNQNNRNLVDFSHPYKRELLFKVTVWTVW